MLDEGDDVVAGGGFAPGDPDQVDAGPAPDSR
jgi:hypothetical protein